MNKKEIYEQLKNELKSYDINCDGFLCKDCPFQNSPGNCTIVNHQRELEQKLKEFNKKICPHCGEGLNDEI